MGDIIASPPNVMPSALLSVPNKSSVTGQAALMFPLYTGGRLSGAVRAAKALFAAAASDRDSVERNATLETKTAYHRSLLARSTVEVYSNLVKEEQERVRIAEASYKEGRIAKYDLLRNLAGLADAEQQLANAERDAQIAVIDLKTVMGVDPASDVTLSGQLIYEQVAGTPDSYLATALKDRPEIVSARARLNSASAGVDVAKSAYKPQIYASVMEGVSATSDGTDTGFTAGIAVGLPILDGGLRRSAVKEAKAMRDVMKRDEQQAVLGVQQDVNTVWAELQAADRNVQLSEAAVTQAEEDYRVIRLRYESGKAVNVEVLDALASLVRAQNNRLMALYEHNVARDRLARAIGEL
jgi:outer membrane protein TolC